MAKQTFTTGQVLTAAQLTSLQQTAMSGGAAQAKTSSYVLVATDAGTAISMTSTSATTVTVNTGLFAAGDTVFIQNLGSGNLTITAGTATVNTAGSLILPQYDAGILYFVSTSSSVFYDFIQVGAASPLTTKGDLYTFSTSDTRLGVGANGTTLVADSSEATGLKWDTPAAGGGMTLINSGGTTLTGSSVTISSIPSSYKNLQLIIRNFLPANDNATLNIRVNNTSATHGQYYAEISNYAFNGSLWEITPNGGQDNGTSQSLIEVDIFDYANTTNWKTGYNLSFTNNATNPTTHFNLSRQYLVFASTTAISSLVILCGSGNFTSGTAYLYGVS